MQTAALYLRSSKDRHDVSLDAQRRELLELARLKELAVVEEFSDAVESGKDENRPAFQAMLKRLKERDRPWSILLALDTSRIARNRYVAQALEFECDKRGVKIVFAKLPDTDPITTMMMRAIFQAFDQLHSMMSREKGLAGMAENVKQGFRAGGRAPLGYRLEHLPTGAMRDGHPVMKSRLVPDKDADKVAAFLKAMAAGEARRAAVQAAGLDLAQATLIGMEWNALTYAGHTVWNVNAEKLPGGGYRGGTKRRPRGDWLVTHDTHQRLISTEEAERIIARLEAGRARTYRTAATYLLTGVLRTPDGKPWHSSGDGFYRIAKDKRGMGRRIGRDKLEAAVVEKLAQDLKARPFIDALTKEARKMAEPLPDGDLKSLRAEVARLTASIARSAELAAQCETPRPFLDRIAADERKRGVLALELKEKEDSARSAELLRAVSEAQIVAVLDNLAANLETLDREALKDAISSLVGRIVLDPETLRCRIEYAIPTGELLASPRGAEQFPALRVIRALKIA